VPLDCDCLLSATLSRLPSSRLCATPAPRISPLSLHDALPICCGCSGPCASHRNWALRSIRTLGRPLNGKPTVCSSSAANGYAMRSEEHTSELQSRENLVCRLLLEKKKNTER